MFKAKLNKKSEVALEIYLQQPAHAVLLKGQVGVGLDKIAEELAKQVAGGNILKIKPKLHKQQKTENINFDDIVGIKQLLRSKQDKSLAIIIFQAEKMTPRAPEALLKLLEEPGENIHFILTAACADKLPQTILSRTQIINILPIDSKQSNKMLSDIKNPRHRTQIAFLAENLPEEIEKLSNDEEYFREKIHHFEVAKDFFSKDTYERLKVVAKIGSRDEALALIDSLAKITLHLSPDKIKPENLEILATASDNLAANGNIKAQLTFLALNMV